LGYHRGVSTLPEATLELRGHDDLRLVASGFGDPGSAPVVLLHGGGQTRHAWRGTAIALAAAGYHALAIDARGHGDSDWHPEGHYDLTAFAADLHAVLAQLSRRAAVVGASLGGLTALLAHGEHAEPPPFDAIVLVDVAPRLEPAGVSRILAFMTAHREGFASLDDAADAIARYLPDRPRPKDTSGLAKNLRLGEDGRYHWHWDPRFLERDRRDPSYARERFESAARGLHVPTLLVRGRRSDVLSEQAAREFCALAPHAELADIARASHMVAGDRNDAFSAAIVEFLERRWPAATIG
jgi:pimeloyl-ACP methyl ester carboxylesterase